MKKKELMTDIVFVIDESGSMNNLTDDTIGGFNSYIKSQKDEAHGSARLTAVAFNSDVRVLYKNVDIRDVADMSRDKYKPLGSTALYDAIGEAIDMEEANILSSETIPDNVIMVIITDGEENSSKKFNKAAIKSRLSHLQSLHGWKVIFTGANIDSFAEAEQIGINTVNTINYTYTGSGVRDLYKGLSVATSSVRADGVIDNNWKNEVTTNDK